MKHSFFLTFLCAGLLLTSVSATFAQSEIGFRPLFFQNDLFSQKSSFDGVAQGFHAGEFQFGISGRTYFSRHFAGRLETNLNFGRYPFSKAHFSYLNFCAIPEWRVSRSVFLGSGPFVNVRVKDPINTEQIVATGLLANIGFRHGDFEIQCRFQRWLGSSGKFTLGAGLDYFFGLNKKSGNVSLKN